MELKKSVRNWYSCNKTTINCIISSIVSIMVGLICLFMILRMMHLILKVDSFVNLGIFEFAAIEGVFLTLIVLLTSICLTLFVLVKPKEGSHKSKKKDDKNGNEEKSFFDRVELFIDMLSNGPRKDNYFWQGGLSVFTYLILKLVRVLRVISVLQLCKLIYRVGIRWLIKGHKQDVDEGSWRPNVPPLLQEIYYFIWGAILISQMFYSCLRCPLAYDLDVYFLIESTTWILYYGVFRRFFEEKYSIYHVMEHLPIIFLLIPLQAVSYALICTYSGDGITWHELLPVLLGQASDNFIFFSLLGFLYSVIVIGMILNSFPDEKIKPGNPNTIIVGAGDVVRNRLLKAMIHKKSQLVKEDKIGKIQIYSREWEEPLRKTLQFNEQESEEYDTERIPDTVKSIYSLVKENFKDNNIVAWIETPSDTHLCYLRLLLDKADFIAVEKPVVSNISDLFQLKDFISSEARKYTFFLSYYILEKALPLTFLKRPNSFYLNYLEEITVFKVMKASKVIKEIHATKESVKAYKGEKIKAIRKINGAKVIKIKSTVETFYQSFLELGRIKKINIKLIELSDNRDLPPGGQLIETFIHHCLIASLFVGLPQTWKIIEYKPIEGGKNPSIYLSACGEQKEGITLYLEKGNSKKEQLADLTFDHGRIIADFVKKEATIIKDNSEVKEVCIGVSRKYKGPYEVQCDMVYRCYLNQIDPSNLDGLFHQTEVLEWLLHLGQGHMMEAHLASDNVREK